jgi:hypothetical protein
MASLAARIACALGAAAAALVEAIKNAAAIDDLNPMCTTPS